MIVNVRPARAARLPRGSTTDGRSRRGRAAGPAGARAGRENDGARARSPHASVTSRCRRGPGAARPGAQRGRVARLASIWRASAIFALPSGLWAYRIACWARRRPCGERAKAASLVMSGMARPLPGLWEAPCVPSGAEAIVELLDAAGVTVCFGLPGVHTPPLWEALRRSPIRLVGVRHEQAAVYAADGFARATGRLGVALVTTGPGAANAAAAVGEAWGSRSPVLLVATDIPTTLRRPGVHRGALHETTDQASLFAAITAARFRAT